MHPNYFGPKIFNEYQRIALITIFRRSQKSLRDFVDFLLESRWPRWLDLRAIPGKSTISDWCKKYSLGFVRNLHRKLLRKTTASLLAIDATGIDSWQRSRHYERRIGEPYVPYAKLDILVDTKSKIILDFVLRIKPRHDTLGAKTIFDRSKLKDLLVLADKGYDSEPLHLIAKQNRLTLFSPVRESPRERPRGLNRKRCARGLKEYHQRNIVESVMRMIKSRFVHDLKSKKHYMKKRELAWKLLAYNIERINKTTKSYFLSLLRRLIPDTAYIKTNI